MLYYVIMHHACYGVETKGNTIVAAPPIADWCIGRSIEVLIDVVSRRGGSVEILSVVCPSCGMPYHPTTHMENEPCPELFGLLRR